jgi:hypothetical protein
MSLTAPEQPDTTGQDPAAPAATPAAPTPPAPVGDSPWSPDLALLFEDEATRTKVDQYLRTKIQPHTTKLEQDVAAQRDAVELWSQLTEKPADAYADITAQLLGDNAQPVLDYIKQLQEQQPSTDPGQLAPFDPAQDPRLAEIMQDYETRKAETYYDQEFGRILATAVDLTDADPAVQESKQRLYHMCVNQEGGDFDKALELYRATVSPFGPPAPIVPPAPGAPPAIGSDAGGANPSAAPTVPQKQTLDEAINDFMSEQRASREAPPVMG